ncbi:MAG TPA: hypothetical protein VFI03_03690 [Solirubrobacterales bacterium]|nr:hypothetical protein [Solirubrobacterales bacterium]
MGAVAKGNTPALEIIFDRVIAMIENEDDSAYPNDSVFVPADHPDFGAMIGSSLLEENPIVVVYADGRERIIPARPALPVPARPALPEVR